MKFDYDSSKFRNLTTQELGENKIAKHLLANEKWMNAKGNNLFDTKKIDGNITKEEVETFINSIDKVDKNTNKRDGAITEEEVIAWKQSNIDAGNASHKDFSFGDILDFVALFYKKTPEEATEKNTSATPVKKELDNKKTPISLAQRQLDEDTFSDEELAEMLITNPQRAKLAIRLRDAEKSRAEFVEKIKDNPATMEYFEKENNRTLQVKVFDSVSNQTKYENITLEKIAKALNVALNQIRLETLDGEQVDSKLGQTSYENDTTMQGLLDGSLVLKYVNGAIIEDPNDYKKTIDGTGQLVNLIGVEFKLGYYKQDDAAARAKYHGGGRGLEFMVPTYSKEYMTNIAEAYAKEYMESADVADKTSGVADNVISFEEYFKYQATTKDKTEARKIFGKINTDGKEGLSKEEITQAFITGKIA